MFGPTPAQLHTGSLTAALDGGFRAGWCIVDRRIALRFGVGPEAKIMTRMLQIGDVRDVIADSGSKPWQMRSSLRNHSWFRG